MVIEGDSGSMACEAAYGWPYYFWILGGGLIKRGEGEREEREIRSLLLLSLGGLGS